EMIVFGQKLAHPPVLVGSALADGLPRAHGAGALERDGDVGRRTTAGGVENVRGDRAHCGFIILRNRRRVIFFCSSAAMSNSSAGGLSNRSFKIASISSADFPVAQTIKMCPNFLA